MEKNKIVKRLPKTETKIDIKPSIELKPIIKIDDGMNCFILNFHNQICFRVSCAEIHLKSHHQTSEFSQR